MPNFDGHGNQYLRNESVVEATLPNEVIVNGVIYVPLARLMESQQRVAELEDELRGTRRG